MFKFANRLKSFILSILTKLQGKQKIKTKMTTQYKIKTTVTPNKMGKIIMTCPF